MNRARAKLEKQSERQMTSVGRDAERLEIEDYYWWVRPSDMNDALAKIADNIHTTTDSPATASPDHVCLWSSTDWNERRHQYHVERFPAKHGQHLQSILTTCAAKSHLMSLEIDRVLGGVKKTLFQVAPFYPPRL